MPRIPHPPPIHTEGPRVAKHDLDSSVGGMRHLPPPSQRMTVARDVLREAIRARMSFTILARKGYTGTLDGLYKMGLHDGANIAIEALTALGVLYVE